VQQLVEGLHFGTETGCWSGFRFLAWPGRPVETTAELAAAALRGVAVVRAGQLYVIDARIDPGYADKAAPWPYRRAASH
jgi:hypothetical protein